MAKKYDYDSFNPGVQLFLDSAMDYYLEVMDKEIIIDVKDSPLGNKYILSDKDKIIVSLLISGFDWNIIREYADINVKNVCKFFNFPEPSTIISNILTDNEHKEFFEKHFAHYINKWANNDEFKIRVMCPLAIINCIKTPRITDSEILNFFNYQFNQIEIENHPLFVNAATSLLLHGYIKMIEYTQDDIEEMTPNNINNDFSNEKLKKIDYFNNTYIDKDFEKARKDVQEEQKSDLILDDNIWELVEKIKKKFVGQEQTVEDLFYNIVNNLYIANNSDNLDGQRSIIFLDGPSGTGKTAITKEITDRLGIPFVATSIVNYSSTGYVGGNITDTLKTLYERAGHNLKLAEKGIIVFDEFDKITSAEKNGLEMKKAVQQQLLDFMGGGKYSISTDNNFFAKDSVEFDTSKITFICLGALTNLREHKQKKEERPLGFSDSVTPVKQEEESKYSITPQDLIDIGLEKELVARFNTFLHTEEYSKEMLYRILTTSDISPILGFKKWVEANNKELEIEESVYDTIADYAYELNTGARSLQTIMDNIRTRFIKTVLNSNETTIKLTSNDIKMIIENTFKRKGRV